MTTLVVPPRDKMAYPTLGWQVAEFLTGFDRKGNKSENWPGSIFGPGSLKGEKYRLDGEKFGATLKAYELFPHNHELAGRRRFKRVGLSWRKGTAKTEWAAQIAYAELHPDGPVRFDHWEGWNDKEVWPVGRPVTDPYIPMVAYNEDQAEELAYGALMFLCREGYDGDFFDVGTTRIIRLGGRGEDDGKAVALAGSPNANDGARTTFQHFDETHRMELPRLVKAHETMLANIPKRPLDDPWSLETTTAGRPGGGSVAEVTHKEAEQIAQGHVKDPDLFFMHREAGPGHNLKTLEGRIEAIREATGPAGEYGPGQFHDIAKQWDRPGVDKTYLERVWLNRWTRSDLQAFDLIKFDALSKGGFQLVPGIGENRKVTLGFDGARFRDSTGLVATDIETGFQQVVDLWERPDNASDDWQVPEHEVNEAVLQAFTTWQVWRMYGDPPHWQEEFGAWAGKWPDQVVAWWTARRQPMGRAVRAYREAIDSGAIHHNGDERLIRHTGNAGRVETNLYDEDGQKVVILGKIRPEAKFDLCMAAVLSWQARIDALAAGVMELEETFVPYRLDRAGRAQERQDTAVKDGPTFRTYRRPR
jgi:hypothetical protein